MIKWYKICFELIKKIRQLKQAGHQSGGVEV